MSELNQNTPPPRTGTSHEELEDYLRSHEELEDYRSELTQTPRSHLKLELLMKDFERDLRSEFIQTTSHPTPPKTGIFHGGLENLRFMSTQNTPSNPAQNGNFSWRT